MLRGAGIAGRGVWRGVKASGALSRRLSSAVYFQLIRAMGAGRAAYNSVIVPVVAMALSTVFESYRWTGLAASGAVLAMVGLVIALAGRRGVPAAAVQAAASPPEPA